MKQLIDMLLENLSAQDMFLFRIACGIGQWTAIVNCPDFGGMAYRPILLPEGTLLLYDYRETDGAAELLQMPLCKR